MGYWMSEERALSKSIRVPGVGYFGKLMEDIADAGRGIVVTEFTPLVPMSIDAIRSFWLAKRDVDTVSGIRAIDPAAAIKQTLRATIMLQDVAKVDAEFISETAEEAFSESLMPGIAGAMRAEAAIKMGFEPWTQPHQNIDPVFTALADQLAGIIWPNLVHTKVEQFWQDMSTFWQKYSDMVYTLEALANPYATLLSADALLQAVGQVYANIMDAINALYTRVTEAYTIYLGVKSLYSRGYVGKEEYDNAILFILSTLESVKQNIEQLEQELYSIDDILQWFIDEDEAGYVQASIETIQDMMAGEFTDWMRTYLAVLFANRVIKPRAGVLMRTYVSGIPSEHEAYI